MLHNTKTPKGELTITATDDDVALIYRSILNAGWTDRQTLYPVKTFIEERFKEELARPVTRVMNQ